MGLFIKLNLLQIPKNVEKVGKIQKLQASLNFTTFITVSKMTKEMELFILTISKLLRRMFKKHLALSFEGELNFLEHINEKVEETNEIIDAIKINLSLQRFSLIAIYKSFIRPLTDYGNILYDQPNNTSSFTDKVE